MPLGNSSQLQIPLIAESDNQKYILHNDAVQALDDSLNRLLTLDLSSSDVTLTETQLTRYGAFRSTGNAVSRNLTIPATVGGAPAVTTNRFFIFENQGTSDVTLTHGGAGNTVAVAGSTVTLVYCDGTDITGVASASGFDMGIRDEGGADFVSNPTFMNFVGNGVAAALNGSGADVTVTLSEARDDGSSQQTDTTFFNFTGAGVTVTANGDGVDVAIPGATASGINVEEEGVATVTGTSTMNYIGNNVTVTDNAGDADVTIQGPAAQDEGGNIQTDPTFINFVGAGVTAAANGNGVDVTIPGGGSSGVDVEDTGVSAITDATVLDFHGNNVTAADVGGEARVTVVAPTAQDEGSNVQTDPTFINFIGAGVTATASSTGVDVTIPGASGTAIPVDDDVSVVASADRLNFTGAGVTVSADGTTADIDIPGGASVSVSDEGTQVLAAPTDINFVGPNVSVADDTDGTVTVTVAGASIVSKSGAAENAVDADFAGNVIANMTNASANTYTIPSGLTNTEPMTLVQYGAGQTTIVAGGGVTLNSADGYLNLRVQYSSVTIIPQGSNTYLIIGDLAA